jgi:flagellar assembly factor FliW
MKIITKFFGEIDVDENNIINFDEGIPGFENFKSFIVLDMDEKSSLKCLQSIKNVDICLILIAPWDYFYDYEIELSDEEQNELGIKRQEDVAVYNVITIRKDKITANLTAPIVINTLNMKGKQIILSNTKYKLRQEIKCS